MLPVAVSVLRVTTKFGPSMTEHACESLRPQLRVSELSGGSLDLERIENACNVAGSRFLVVPPAGLPESSMPRRSGTTTV
jgi:hypothetical protein